MLEQIRRFFESNFDVGENQEIRQESVHLAMAALLLEVMVTDDYRDPGELQAIRQSLSSRFGLSSKLLDELVDLAEQEVAQATSLYQFTAAINEHFGRREKLGLVTALWQVAYADGTLDKYEEGLIRKIADLLHLSHSDFLLAKHRARSAQ